MNTKEGKLVLKILEKMFWFAKNPKTIEQIRELAEKDKRWFSTHTMTKKQSEAWCKWGIKEIKKTMRWPLAKSEKEMAWIHLQWGLRETD